MSVNINLILRSSIEESKKIRQKKLKNYSFVLLFLVGFASVLIFLINYRFSVNYVKKQEQDLVKKISIYDNTALKMVLLNSRLSEISSILSERPEEGRLLRSIDKAKSGSLIIEEFTLTSGGVNMKISSESLLDIDNFLNEMAKEIKSGQISNISIQSFSLEEDKYTMELSLK